MRSHSKLLVALLICLLATSTLASGIAFADGLTIHVEKYHDLDKDGDRDGDEPDLEGWEFTLYDSEGTEVASGTTDENGQVSFTNLPPGAYEVCETLPDGWVNSDPDSTCQTVILGSGSVTPGPSSATLDADGNKYLIEFLGTSNGGLTWTYRVTEVEGKDLSHWILGLCMGKEAVTSWDPTAGDDGIEGVELVYPDPTTNVSGIKWDVRDDYNNDGTDEGDVRIFSFTLDEVYSVGTTYVGIKTGGQIKTATGFIAGPHCGDGPSEVTVVFGNHEEDGTAIDLASFTAQGGAGSVTLAWETGTEVDNAGFNLYRAMLKDGPYTQINEALIAAQGDAVSGASYSFLDAPDYGTFYYKLEDVDFYGVSTLHGPVKVTVARPLRRPLYRPRLPEF